MKLSRTIGFEMTGIVDGYKETSDREPHYSSRNMTTAISILIANELVKMYPRNFQVKNYTDNHCVEFPSPVFKSIRDLDKFYNSVKHLFDKFKVTPHNPLTVCGGNHFHFGLNMRNDKKFIKNIFRDFVNRPYIPWVFTQPDDTSSAGNYIVNHNLFAIQSYHNYLPLEEALIEGTNRMMFFSDSLREFYKLLATNKKVDFNSITNWDKGGAITLNCPDTRTTLEFRCFEAPLNFQEFREQYTFLLAYLDFASKLKDVPPVVFWNNADFQRLTPEECEEDFNNFLLTLKLNPLTYKKYVKRNLYPRWEQNRERE